MRRGFKLSTLDGDIVAEQAARDVLDTAERAAAGLGAKVVLDGAQTLTATRVYRVVRRLCAYAKGKGRAASPTQDIASLSAWCGADAVSTTTKTKTPLQLIITAAEARCTFERHDVLTSAQVAALCDLDRDHVNGMAGRGEIPGAYRLLDQPHQPWRFGGAAFRKWLSARIEADQPLRAEVAP